MLPEAHVGHLTASRVRIKVPSQKGDSSYFQEVRKAFLGYRKFERLEVNPCTGSVLIVDENLDVGGAVKYAEEKGLFKLQKTENNRQPLSHRLVRPLKDFSASLENFTGGELDLPGLAFISLLGVGIYQILRGNLRSPPWYTAFWYALGVFTKSLVDKDIE